jgi:hybrid cluster-associated redox disulfide protein
MNNKITKEMHIQEIIQQHPETISVFKNYELDCANCQIAEFEEISHGAKVHHIDPDRLVEELNAVITEEKD